MKKWIKSFLPGGRRPHRVLSGLCRGLQLDLDPACESQLWAGLYEKETHDSLAAMAGQAQAFVDIGAGFGDLSVWFACRHPGRPVLAAEPDPEARSRMVHNFSLNFPQLPSSIRITDQFIDNQPGTLSLDEATHPLPDPVLVKIDTEGAELRILQSGSACLQKKSARFLIETHSLELEKSCQALLHSFGYRTRIIPPAYWRRWLPEHRPPAHNQWLVATPDKFP